MDKVARFVFIVPSYNNRDWVARNIDSICVQDHPRWRAIYVDDASTDGTLELARQRVAHHRMNNRFVFLRNSRNMKQAYSRFVGYNHRSCRDSDIAVLLDGDDWLLHPRVLSVLDREYRRHRLRASYGQFVRHHRGAVSRTAWPRKAYPDQTVESNAYREHPVWLAGHLRTAEVGLLRQIPREYLTHRGAWIDRCTDVAEMMFVLERSGGRHRRIGEPLVVYNMDNSVRHANSFMNTHQSAAQRELHLEIVKKYAPGLASPRRIRGAG